MLEQMIIRAFVMSGTMRRGLRAVKTRGASAENLIAGRPARIGRPRPEAPVVQVPFSRRAPRKAASKARGIRVMNAIRKTAAAALALLTIAGATVAGTGEAEAKRGRNAALIGGLAAGAVLGGILMQNQAHAAPVYGGGYAPRYGGGYGGGYYGGGYAPAYHGYAPAYSAPRPVYVERHYAPQCRIVRERVVDAWGDTIQTRRVRVCD
jgi:hypothetical protein